MKIDIRERLNAAAASGVPFEQQVAKAKASGRPFGKVSDAKLGRHVIYHAADEIAEWSARAAEEAATPKPKTLEERMADLEKKVG